MNSLCRLTGLLVVFWLLVVMVSLGHAEESETKILAADLVEDGQAVDLNSPRYKGLFKELRLRHHFTQEEIDRYFSGVTIRKRVLELMDTQWESKPYYEYFPRFITSEVIKEGRWRLKKYKSLLDKIEQDLGVEREIIMAIWGIETRYGQYAGAFNMFRTLNTMFDAYPRRREFYRKQLIAFMLLCRANDVDPLAIKGSYGGAFGQTQFIPSSFTVYAIDFDGDGKRDVWSSIPDILASIANYLKNFSWKFNAPIYYELGSELKNKSLVEAFRQGRKGLLSWEVVRQAQRIRMIAPQDNKPVTIVGLELKGGGMRYVAGYPNFQAITKWNNSNRYAMAVVELAASY